MKRKYLNLQYQLRGQGKELPFTEIYRGISHEISLLKGKVIAVNDDFVKSATDAICSVARKDSDKRGGYLSFRLNSVFG